ncbi:DUF2690 domain-containing protein [Streptomyces sp. LHD-70]|uniref:DUF2690 domain-containing protein n=1 Tax=Streptomyces sp. LHD-70 TaxID=3072140 RepID=UPI0028102238|nr:DUF2690 domain-containing protein [Streptomyces sp. LHD-70]MDQ8704533.1 DUF2690 domain-containing protein [Streptomyces sp. LHD-70]
MGVARDEQRQAAKRELALLLRSWWEEHPDKITQEALARRITERGVQISQEMLSRYLNRSRPTTARPDVIRTMHEVLRRAPEELSLALNLQAQAQAQATEVTEAPDITEAATATGEPGETAEAPPARPAPPTPSRKKWPWIAVAAAVVGASGLTAFMTLGEERRGTTPPGHRETPSASLPAEESTSAGTQPPAEESTSTGTQPPAECRGESCFGIDAKYAVCREDAATYYTARAHGVFVELRFSPACQAAWAKMSGTSQGDVVRVTNNAGRSRHYTQQWGHDAHTTMVEAVSPDDAKACAHTPRGQVCATKAVTPTPPGDAGPSGRR